MIGVDFINGFGFILRRCSLSSRVFWVCMDERQIIMGSPKSVTVDLSDNKLDLIFRFLNLPL